MAHLCPNGKGRHQVCQEPLAQLHCDHHQLMTVNRMGPSCPCCGAWITRVVLTKRDADEKFQVRRRWCEFCDHRFYTVQANEVVAEDIKWRGSSKGTVPIVSNMSTLD
jgi:hypothetical protein